MARAISVTEFEPRQEAELSIAKEKPLPAEELLKKLGDGGYDQAEYTTQLTVETSSAVKTVPLDGKTLEKLDRLPLSFSEIKFAKFRLDSLFREASQFETPKAMPDISKMNYMTQLGEIIQAFTSYGVEKLQKNMRGKNRTLDLVMEEVLEVVGSLQGYVAQALAHSAAVINGITLYQEKTLEARIAAAGNEWRDATEELQYAQNLLRNIAACKPSCMPKQYTVLATAERNLAREIQHLKGEINEAEAIAVYSSNIMATVNALEGNLRTGLLALKYLSGIVAQAMETAKYAAQGSMLLRDGYKNVDIIAKATESVEKVLHYHDREINKSITAFNENLKKAEKDLSAPKQAESSGKVYAIDYDAMHARAKELFEERGLNKQLPEGNGKA